ncbi:relaxase/mobilization nuclease domain-containing protein [Bradyrhizobium sp. 40]|uniref:relaxase/mobilization nuclease domain-containing protein n=1 Tax=Bradyrhizobium sp. 40 TaxID=2782674 RepID=UPI001FFFDAF5|nr:relaxase/mobilization nuclease domain-containing protein [Bradyrhizobium sp. 40]UPJ44955.1 relaxase/mobilization nuclease domain-containing protein [Bradyrhizobium sp. 40]
MVPKVAGKGHSFKGAGLYYLHDKKAETNERVDFAYTVNLPTRDPDKAIRMMAYTAMHQSEIKARAGGSTRGRKLADPVYCYSLSWAPGEEPTRDEMVKAARETLKVLGMESHEALLIGHNDEPHPHIHVIVNRVNPETGIAAPLKMDHLKLSTWAEGYEKQQGKIRCEQRVENNELRRKGEFVKDWQSVRKGEYQRWQTDRVSRQVDRRIREDERLDKKQAHEREQIHRARDSRIADQRNRFREAHRGDWRDLYSIQRQEQRRLAEAQKNPMTRLSFFLRAHREEYRAAGKDGRKIMLKGAAAALVGSKTQTRRLELKQTKERLFFAGKLKREAERIKRPIDDLHKKEMAGLARRHDDERHDLRMAQSKESQAQAHDIKSGRSKELFRKEQRGKLREELKENKQEATSSKVEPRAPTLSERFATFRGRTKQSERQIEPKAVPGQKARQPDKEQQNEAEPKDHNRSGSLAGKFRKAQEPGVSKKAGQQFKDNASDMSKDIGREITRKPPK